VGRRHLSRLALGTALSLAAVTPVAAATIITWRVIAQGVATSPASANPYAIVATSSAAARSIVVRVPPSARAKALAVDYRSSVVVGVFGPFGCRDHRVHVSRIDERSHTLRVHLTMTPLPPGTMECQAIFPTYRLLVVPRSALSRVPTRASVSLVAA